MFYCIRSRAISLALQYGTESGQVHNVTQKNTICDLVNSSPFSYVYPCSCNSLSWGPKPQKLLGHGYVIVKGWLQDTWNGLPFTEKPCLGIVILCSIKENWGMMERRKPKRIQVLLQEHLSDQRDSKSIWLQLQTSQTINLSVFYFHTHTKKIQEQVVNLLYKILACLSCIIIYLTTCSCVAKYPLHLKAF